MPSLYVAPNPQPNAFATGRNPSHAAVCVNSGLLDMLTWDEVRGVLAHEMSHVKNRDILISSVAAAIAMAITFAARIAHVGRHVRRWSARRGGGIGDILMIVLAPIAAMLLQASISRSREFQADRSAARLIGTDEPLATRAREARDRGSADPGERQPCPGVGLHRSSAARSPGASAKHVLDPPADRGSNRPPAERGVEGTGVTTGRRSVPEVPELERNADSRVPCRPRSRSEGRRASWR